MVKYHTSISYGQKRRERQSTFLDANKVNPKFEYYLGKFKPDDNKEIREKKTDVNIAVNMIRDVLKKNCESIFLISGDSDLVPAIKFLFELDPKIKIYVFFPPKRFSFEIQNNVTNAFELGNYENNFINNQLNPKITISEYVTLVKPESWI